MQRYPIPAARARAEILVVNSRFIATAGPVFSVDEAREFVAQVKAEFADASHNVPAYIVGYGASVVAHCSDDGEPSGTAGRPALAVLSGSGLGDVAVVITRYFGGTKLGTGGLVRAYSDSVRAVLEALPRAEKVETLTAMLALPYNWVERMRLLVTAQNGEVLDETFGADVTMTARFALERYPAFKDALAQASHGSLEPQVIETGTAIMPIDALK
jgi:uncharacterized YigZ family protein